MIFITIIGVVLYFILPIVLILYSLDRLNIDYDAYLLVVALLIVEIALFVQIMYWMGIVDVSIIQK